MISLSDKLELDKLRKKKPQVKSFFINSSYNQKCLILMS